MKTKRNRIIATVVGLILVAAVTAVMLLQSNKPSRQEEVYDKGQSVMPFEQDKTTHVFTSLENGGDQKVVVNNANDSENLRLIREHLQEEQQKFQAGDLSDPAAIHGESMPGLAELSQAAKNGEITVTYKELADGAKLEYRTSDKTAVEALHKWFDAQKADHGEHAH